MKVVQNWSDVKEAGESRPIPRGIYICKVEDATDVGEKEYLKVKFDIADVADPANQEFIGEMGSRNEQFKSWPNVGTITKSYKKSALPFFKAFITAIEKSNPGFIWRWDETTLKGKLFVAVFGEEEWWNGEEIRVNCKVQEVRSIPAYKEGNIKLPELKKMTPENLVKAQEAFREKQEREAEKQTEGADKGEQVPPPNDEDAPF